MTHPTSESGEPYSPHLRTALLFAGTGTAGAYHAGVLRALQEAGVKIDLVGGCGMGAASALFAAIDASAHLSEESSFWRSASPHRLYPVRLFQKFLAGCLALSLLSVVLPVAAVVAAALVFPLSFFLGMLGFSLGDATATAVVQRLYAAFEPDALPSILPRIAVVGLALAFVALLVESLRARRRFKRRQESAPFWWGGLSPLLDAASAVAEWRGRLWRAIAGGPVGRQPDDRDLSARYTEMLAENLGQPGFRELLLVVHDIDARRDLVFGLLSEQTRRDFFSRRPLTGSAVTTSAAAIAARPRSAEAFDLSGIARDRLLDVLSASLRPPVATEPHLFQFSADGYWRGETHRLVHRPESIARLLEEAREAGARQIIIACSVAEPPGPHSRTPRPVDVRSQIGEYISTSEGAAVRDTVRSCGRSSETVFLIQPSYNPLNSLDFGGRHDALSDRHYSLAELVERGYEDTYRQFIEPVVAAGGEQIS